MKKQDQPVDAQFTEVLPPDAQPANATVIPDERDLMTVPRQAQINDASLIGIERRQIRAHEEAIKNMLGRIALRKEKIKTCLKLIKHYEKAQEIKKGSK